jgi:segregation and condensation protein B
MAENEIKNEVEDLEEIEHAELIGARDERDGAEDDEAYEDEAAEDDAGSEGAEEGDFPEPVETLGREQTRHALYAMLFASDRPLSAGRLAEVLGDIDKDVVATLLEELREEVNSGSAPYELREIAGGYQLVTKTEYAPFIRRLFQVKKSPRLSRAALETLAVIAYKQPVTRADVEAVRGVSVSYAFEQLQEKRLIKVVGVAELPGRPKLYRTTDEFLVHFGLKSLKELPSLEELHLMM